MQTTELFENNVAEEQVSRPALSELGAFTRETIVGVLEARTDGVLVEELYEEVRRAANKHYGYDALGWNVFDSTLYWMTRPTWMADSIEA